MNDFYYVIRISQDHPDAGLFWCGHEKGCHKWLPDFKKAIKFCTEDDAQRAGVSGPNTPYHQHDSFKNRGTEVWKMGPTNELQEVITNG